MTPRPSDYFELRLPSEAQAVSTARLFATTIARSVECDDELTGDVRIAISECVTRAMRDPGSGDVIIRASIGDDGASFEVEGPAAEEGDTDLGLAVIRSLFPNAALAQDGDRTIVRFAAVRTAAGSHS